MHAAARAAAAPGDGNATTARLNSNAATSTAVDDDDASMRRCASRASRSVMSYARDRACGYAHRARTHAMATTRDDVRVDVGRFDSSGGGDGDAPERARVGGAYTTSRQDAFGLPYVVKFNSTDGTWVAIGDEDGYVTILDALRALPREDETGAGYAPYSSILAHNNAIFDVAWMRDDKQILTASADHGIHLFDVETSVQMMAFDGHASCVKALAAQPTSKYVFASGGRDGRLLVFDARTRGVVREGEDAPHASPIRTVNYAHKLPGVRAASRRSSSCLHSVTSVTFDNSGDVVLSSGGSDGIVKLWDVRYMKGTVGVLEDARDDSYVPGSFYDHDLGRRFGGVRASSSSSKKPRGISGIAVDPTSSRVAVSYVDNHMAMFDANAPSAGPMRHFVGHLSSSYYIKPCFSPDGAHVACGSLDHNVHIWNVARPRDKSIQLTGHALGVNVVHWSSRADALASCSDDGATRVWSVNPYKAPAPRQFAAAKSSLHPAMNERIRLALGGADGVDETDACLAATRTPTKLARVSPNTSAQSTPGAVSSPFDPTPEKAPPQKQRKRVREPFNAVDINASDR
jgi:denticleless